MNAPYTNIIWDFNGTLLNDVDACVQSANALLTAHHLPTLQSHRQYRAIFGFPVMDYYERLGFDFALTPFPDLAVEWVDYYNHYSRDATLYEEAVTVLSRVRAMGIPQYVLSATETQMLERQIDWLGIGHYFNGVLGMDDIHAHGKIERGIAWRKENPTARVLLIGDTDHDAAVARAMGADFALFSGGHQSKERLLACHPICVLDHLTDVTDLLRPR